MTETACPTKSNIFIRPFIESFSTPGLLHFSGPEMISFIPFLYIYQSKIYLHQNTVDYLVKPFLLPSMIYVYI